MATYDYVEDWYNKNMDLVEQFVLDDEKILTSANGKKKGVYLVSVKLMEENKLIPMYAGEAGEHDRTIADRLKEHLRIWLGAYTEYWIGAQREELESGRIKLHLHIVGEAEQLETRKEMETETILSEHPYLQYGPYKKYPSKYEGLDLCIVPWKGTRRKAFLDRVEREGVSLEAEKRLIDYVFDSNFKPDWDKCAKARKEKDSIAYELRQELKIGTAEYREVKKLVDAALGIGSGSRGCTYPYIIKLLSHALEEYQLMNALA